MSTKSSKVFITGSDSNTRWLDNWFKSNFYKHNPNAELVVYDFDKYFNENQRWFKKPAAMLEASMTFDSVCWIDNDIEIRSNIERIFDFIEPNKLLMAEDRPWSTRRGEKWHNSGVVGFQGTPKILREWASAVQTVNQKPNPMYGDQDVLHELVRGDMKRFIHITDLPRNYNTLRLDLIDNTAPPTIRMMHWTGAKGKQEIKRQMNE